MKKWSHALFIFVSYCCFICARDVDIQGQLDQSEIDILRDWINTKRQVTVKERGGNLSISGEVRSELQSTNERKAGIKQRGSGGAVSKRGIREWDVEANLLLDYRTDNTWAAVKVKFDNDAGTSSGTFNKAKLDRAIFGGRFVNADTYTMALEVGRRGFSNAFDSKIEFGSTMDGLLYRYDQAFESIGNIYLHGGAFLIDDRIDHYGYVAELGLLDIANTGLYSKYSLIDWDTKHRGKRIGELEEPSTKEEKKARTRAENQRYQFFNHQLLIGYKFKNKWVQDKITTFYLVGLINTAAKSIKLSLAPPPPVEEKLLKKFKKMRHKRANYAWYGGMSIGELRKKWDWSLDINYQWVQAQTIPDFDGNGIGRGNVADVGLYTTKSGGGGDPTTISNSVGSGNYKGFVVEFFVMLTSSITVYQAWRQSITLDTSISPRISYKQYELELIYAF